MVRYALSIACCVFVAFPSGAAAKKVNTPPGNAGLEEYLETVPGGRGKRTTDRPAKSNPQKSLSQEALGKLGVLGEDRHDVAGAASDSDPVQAGSSSAGGRDSGKGARDGGGSKNATADGPPRTAAETASDEDAGGLSDVGLLPLWILLVGSLVAAAAYALVRRRYRRARSVS